MLPSSFKWKHGVFENPSNLPSVMNETQDRRQDSDTESQDSGPGAITAFVGGVKSN